MLVSILLQRGDALLVGPGIFKILEESKAKCLLMLLTNIYSRVLQQMHVSDTGL